MNLLLSIFGSCLPCIPSLSTPSIKFNNASYYIVRLLGEGGFSYVYLVHLSSQSPFALKQINCPYGTQDETYKNAIREIKNYHRFANTKTPYIVQSIDESIVSSPDGVRHVYILLPYFTKSVQDILTEHVLNGTKMDELEILKIFVGVCRGLRIMHNHKQVSRNTAVRLDDDDGDEEEALLQDEEDDEQVAAAAAATVSTAPPADGATEMEELVPYAHHDIKPANVMISAEGLPVLVDLGSCSRARYHVRTRQQALALTNFAQEHCTLPYRAPELLDVTTGSHITEATDVWSLGCLLYSCCFGYSPFEKLEMEQGANLHVAIGQGRYQIPKGNNGYSNEVIGLIKKCLQVDASDRPTVDQLLDEGLDITSKLSV